MPGNGNGRPPDWIPPGHRPEDDGDAWDDHLHGDWYWDLDDGWQNDAASSFQQAQGGFYSIVWVKPTTRFLSGQLSPIVTVKPHSNDGTLMTVEIESATNSSFTSGVVTTTLTNKASDVDVSQVLGPFTDLTSVWLRARAGASGNWSEWAGPVQVDLNTGVSNGGEYVLQNVGFTLSIIQAAGEYVVENVGFTLIPWSDGEAYVLEGDVNTLTPTPYIWWIEPTAGRANDGFDIYGHGFGATQGAYSGVAYLDPGPGGTRRDLAVVDWVQVPANSVAYDQRRLLSQDYVGRSELRWQDNFDGTGAVDAAWSSPTGSTSAWSVAGGLLVPPASEDVLYVPGVDTGTVTVVADGPGGKIVVRYHDSANYFYLNLANNDLVRVLAGAEVTVGSWAGAAVAGDTYEVVVTPTTIQAKRNGSSLGTASDSNLGDAAVYLCSVGVRGAATDRWRSFLWDSGIDSTTRIDMEHQRISVSIPADAIPPGYLVRVETNGA